MSYIQLKYAYDRSTRSSAPSQTLMIDFMGKVYLRNGLIVLFQYRNNSNVFIYIYVM